MAITKLPVNFQDDIIDTTINDKRRYRLEENTDGTTSLEDATTYEQVGSYFGAEQINATNGAVNELIDKTSNIDNTADSQKNVLYAERAGVAGLADNATNAVVAQMAESAREVENNFILKNQEILIFNNNNVCTITDNRITADSLADVYFTKDSMLSAEKSVITVESYAGRIELTAGRRPEENIRASIVIRVV